MPASLAIERLTVGCRVPQPVAVDTRRTNDLLDRILSSATQALPGLLRRALACEPESETIAFIDTLHFEVTIDTEWPRDEIARALAAQLVRALWRRLEDPDTVRFKDRAEMLARFVLDLARGAAYTQSWHRSFAGLRLLSASGIVRTLIVEEPLVASAALTRLLPTDLEKVTALLTDSDAERALTAVLSAAQAGVVSDPVAVATAIISQRCLSLQRPQQQLAFTIAMRRETGAAGDAETLALARALVQSASEPDDAMPATAPSDETLANGLRRADAAAAAEAVRILHRELPGDHGSEQSSNCGGIWLLLPHVLAALNDEMKLAPVALCALAFAAGEDATNVWRNELLRAALDLDEVALSRFQELKCSALTVPVGGPLTAEGRDRPVPTYSFKRRNLKHLRSGIAKLNLPCAFTRAATRVAYAGLSAYARRLPGFAESSFAHLWKNFLATPATLRVHGLAFEVILTPPPLDVIWKISGADRATYTLPNGRNVRVGVLR